jgi:hypothetical protein
MVHPLAVLKRVVYSNSSLWQEKEKRALEDFNEQKKL